VQRVGSDDLTLASGVRILSVEILDVFLQPVQVSELLLDETEGIVYNNLVSEFVSLGEFTPYFVKYVIRDGSNVDTFIDLLDNEDIFRVAEFDDLTPTLEIIQDGRKVYLIEETSDGFTVTLPTVGEYSFKPNVTSRIALVPPSANQSDDLWYVRVTNGSFFTNLPDGNLYKFYIAEFLSQTFPPAPPIKRSIDETSTVLSTSLLKLDHENIHESTGDLLFVSIEINDEDGNPLAAYTTDSSLDGTVASNGAIYVFWNNQDREGIRSVDHMTGFVDIDGFTLSNNYEVISNYHFRETNYEFTLIDFNPISNRDATRTRVALFIHPDSATAITSKTQTLFYFKINEYGLVFESNWPQFDNDNQVHITGLPIYYEVAPSWVGGQFDGDGNPVYYLFVSDFSVEENRGIYLILGDMTVSEAQHVTEVVEIDSRVRGGGIIESRIGEAKGIQPEVAWYWDIGNWDGIPYPGNASFMVEIPAEILEGAGGTLRTNKVRDIVNRHVAFGVYPVVRAYGVEIEVTNIQLGTGSITVDWIGHGS
jgi:hypothetical protein